MMIAEPSRPEFFGIKLRWLVPETGEMPNDVSLAIFDRRIGFQPVREDSASRLSAHERTGWKPIGQDRRDAYPPVKLTSLGRMPAPLG